MTELENDNLKNNLDAFEKLEKINEDKVGNT